MSLWLVAAVVAAFALKLVMDRELDRATAAQHQAATGEPLPALPRWPRYVVAGVVVLLLALAALGVPGAGLLLGAGVLVALVAVGVAVLRARR